MPALGLALTLALALALGLAPAACGDQEPARPAAAPVDPGAAIATRADPAGRIRVAEVNGEPIYGDCVATQAAAHRLDRAAALAECVDFELLAQEARRRGLVGDPDVLAARRTELVRALVEADYAPTLDDPSDVPLADLEWLWRTQLHHRYNKPELRRATYCRAPVGKAAPAGGPEDLAARALAGRLHDTLSAMRGLEPDTFAALCWMAAGGREVSTSPRATNPFTREGYQEAGMYAASFVGPAFALRAPGQLSPPSRTDWGWDVILLTEILPAEVKSLADAEADIRDGLIHRPETEPYRRKKFEEWIRPILARHRIQLFPDNLPDDRALARGGAGPGDAPGDSR